METVKSSFLKFVVLGIESTCDDSAAGVVEYPSGRVIADVRRSQNAIHGQYGGIVPNLASRAHSANLPRVVDEAMVLASSAGAPITHVAVASGPGMLACIRHGMEVAQARSALLGVPLVGVNHLEAHTLVSRMGPAPASPAFPFLSLVVSGGNTFLALSSAVGAHTMLGRMLDDAVGQALDKVGRALVGSDGDGSSAATLERFSHYGAALEALAMQGDERNAAARLPVPMRDTRGLDFSFSGVKAACMRLIASGQAPRADVALAFQSAVFDHLADVAARGLMLHAAHGHRLAMESRRAAKTWKRLGVNGAPSPGVSALVVSGGVAANKALLARMERLAAAAGVGLVVPHAKLCVDNGVMIAWAAAERLAAGNARPPTEARAHWPLDATES